MAFVLMLTSFAASAADGPIIFTTAPTQSVEQTHKLYGPMVSYLAAALGKEIKLEPPRNFLEYTSRMRKGEYDIIFDGPHFVGWRIKTLGDIPVAKLPGELVFVAVVKDGGPITDIKQLIGKKVCAVNSPNLATLTVMDQFDNPVRQPVIESVRSFGDAIACLKADKGVAAVVPIKFWGKFTKEGKTAGMRVLYSTKNRPMPTRSFTVSKRIDAETRSKITAALVNIEGKEELKPVLESFRSKTFVVTDEQEYDGLGLLLRSVWGFHEQ